MGLPAGARGSVDLWWVEYVGDDSMADQLPRLSPKQIENNFFLARQCAAHDVSASVSSAMGTLLHVDLMGVLHRKIT